MKFEKRNINADRICDGISRIGYRTHSAIEDIIDNSVAALATEIIIEVEVDPDSTLQEKNNITAIRITDNGIGMDDTRIATALDIGTIVEYPENSLSKYGLGLKSAGLSLGNCVSIFSKQNKKFTAKHILDRDLIRENGTYGVGIDEISKEEQDKLKKYKNGTVVEVTRIKIPHDSAATLERNLIQRLGVIYYDFLSRKNSPLKFMLRVKNKPYQIIIPLDILFLDSAQPSFDPDNYSGWQPCRVLDDSITVLDPYKKPHTVPIKATIFPKDEMKSFIGFDDEKKRKIKEYDVSGRNSGFFIYRNGRLIRWGDNLGLIQKDDRGFRCRIDISTEHDDILHVDVSKQNLLLSEDFLDQLSVKIRIPLSYSREAFTLCTKIKDGGGPIEGSAANETLIDLTEEDPDFGQAITPQERKIRKKRLQQESKKKILEEEGEEQAREQPATTEEFRKIRYSDNIKSTDIYKAETHPDYGTFVRINRNHQFYQLVLSSLNEGDPVRMSLEAFIFTLALGENMTINELGVADYDVIKKVLDKFRRTVSYNLENWSAHNQDIFSK
ncbi:MAG: ATP-binding protein [Candidatus Competibacteraceae bacterium]